jgi:hypothetical protein
MSPRCVGCGDPTNGIACSKCLKWDALFTASELGVLGADPCGMFRSRDPEIDLRVLVRRVALLERAVGLGRLSELVR